MCSTSSAGTQKSPSSPGGAGLHLNSTSAVAHLLRSPFLGRLSPQLQVTNWKPDGDTKLAAMNANPACRKGPFPNVQMALVPQAYTAAGGGTGRDGRGDTGQRSPGTGDHTLLMRRWSEKSQSAERSHQAWPKGTVSSSLRLALRGVQLCPPVVTAPPPLPPQGWLRKTPPG